ncbi:hypothetical protein QM012_004670 [Aureobasidium pullulans]|uniref:Ankyrin repeat protein nuc-2 n=1 Tax=Aureobasidium pullulans TaxID=5580 RepID=A0ABR0TUK5_AURPU
MPIDGLEHALKRKFGKHIQKRQLDIPEYAASFVDYKALKKLIKKLSATPVIHAQDLTNSGSGLADSQASLQANKATFFFRLERELEKVNTFYLQKEAELKLRLKTLADRKKSLQARGLSASKLSTVFVTLDEGFRLFNSDLDKLQQFIEINQTAFSKILKKWDKTSKSRTKELYLSRAVEIQPCFNRDVIRDLSDQATSSLLELGAWAEGEKIEYIPSGDQQQKPQAGAQEDNDIEMQMQQAVNTGNEALIKEWISRLGSTDEARERINRIFLSTINDAPLEMQKTLLETDLVNLNYVDEINERTCLHELSISGRLLSLTMVLERGANPIATDIYGRIPLHYACMRGHVDVVKELVKHDSANAMQGIESTSPDAAPVAESVDYKDLDNFTPLIHGIVHARFAAVQAVLELGARVDPTSEADHIPINLACQYGSVAIVDLLLQYRPQILPDAEGLYPQHLVPRSGRSPQILQMLKNYGANLDQPDKLYQWTPLFHAASEGHLSCLQALLELGVDVDALDEKDLSAMYYAAWEGHLDCLRLLEKAGHGRGITREEPTPAPATFQSILSSSAPIPASADMEAIPDLSLPPPIIPLRRYGHNFLDTTKTFIVISFDSQDAEAIEFYGDNKYPAARLTISSKSSDLIPRNIPLPIQDEFKVISFQIDNLDTFSIDFDIFPTFGSKIIARGAASSLVFSRRYSSSGNWHLELFDPRLRAIGRISFKYQVVTPFHGIPMEITQFATYWKATSQISSQPNALITGSSLSGDYMRIFVQATKDGVPVLYPSWAMPSTLAAYGVRNDLISRLTYEQFSAIGKANGRGPESLRSLLDSSRALLAQGLATSWCSLRDVLEILPPEMHLDVHMLFPTKAEEEQLRLGPTGNINEFVDASLKEVFDHASRLRGTNEGFIRSIVFSSYNANICTALNWKQPNYPVLLCNDLGIEQAMSEEAEWPLFSSGRTTTSVKEAVRIAQSNNFMGLMCSSRLLELVPALIESVKTAGLVLIADVTNSTTQEQVARASFDALPDEVDGYLDNNAVLRFHESIDM